MFLKTQVQSCWNIRKAQAIGWPGFVFGGIINKQITRPQNYASIRFDSFKFKQNTYLMIQRAQLWMLSFFFDNFELEHVLLLPLTRDL